MSQGDAPQPVGSSPGPEKPKERSPWALAGLGMQFFVSLILFAYAGSWLDRRFGSSPLWLMVGVFVGGGGSFFLMVRRLTRSDRTSS